MNEDALAAMVFAATDVLRVEALPSYAVDSDHDWLAAYLRGEDKPDVELKRPWLDRIAAAAGRGHPWRRLRIVDRKTGDYVRYEAEWSYLDNAAAGELIRIVDEAEWADGARSGRRIGDTYVLDGRIVEMRYDTAGRFLSADETGDTERASLAWSLWAEARDFSEWWAFRADLHRPASV